MGLLCVGHPVKGPVWKLNMIQEDHLVNQLDEKILSAYYEKKNDLKAQLFFSNPNAMVSH